MDRQQLADFLRTRRTAMQPEDVGMARGPRRRTDGLRREEVALLCGMSPDYYGRLEQMRGPTPSEQMVAAIARGLHLSLEERDHLFRLVGYDAPSRTLRSDHVSPGLMRVLDRLDDTPAEVITALGETLVQTRLAVALLGDRSQLTGLARSTVYRWFTDPASRAVYPERDHEHHGRIFASGLRDAYSRDPTRPHATAIVDALQISPEFVALWARHEVGLRHSQRKVLVNAEVGELELYCQMLDDRDQDQSLLIFTATPGSPSAEKLALLNVVAASSRPHR